MIVLRARTAVERIRHTCDSQDQILALAFRKKFFNTFKLFPLRSEAVWRTGANGGAGVERNLIAASIYDQHSVGPSILSICTRCCFTMTDMIQANVYWAQVFITNTRLDAILQVIKRDDSGMVKYSRLQGASNVSLEGPRL